MERPALTLRTATTAAVVLFLAGVATWWFVDFGRADSLARARQLAEDPVRFDTGGEAAATMVSISERLEEAGRDCLNDLGSRPRCDALFAATAWARVAGFSSLGCTAPGRFELREAAVAHLAALSSLGPDDALEGVPPLPACATVGGR